MCPNIWKYATYLENRLSMRPTGVVSKKDMGDRKIAYAMRSCNFLEACDDSEVRKIYRQRFWILDFGVWHRRAREQSCALHNVPMTAHRTKTARRRRERGGSVNTWRSRERPQGTGKHTSIEQKIQRSKVCVMRRSCQFGSLCNAQ